MRCLALALLGLAAERVAAVQPRCANGKPCPHIVTVIIDDLGWNNVPWHNPSLAAQMNNSLQLVREGVELDRHYAFLYCSPSRSSFQSGRFPYHVNQINLGEQYASMGVDRRMTTIPRKLKQAGYATHMTGKWHAGMATPEHTPKGRGYDTALGYFGAMEDHFTQQRCGNGPCGPESLVDLWENNGPAYGKNGTYGDKMYTEFAVQTLEAHPLEQPLFFYIAMQNNHDPLQVPGEYLQRFPAEWTHERRHYAAMGAYWDEALGKIIEVLRNRGMWEHTLLVLAADNGGPVSPGQKGPQGHAHHCKGANNWPLFGGKVTNWEGGVRAASFVSGGFLPQAVRGTKQEGNIHIADWYATFCGLAGVDPSDNVPGVPSVDSVDVWPLLSGATTTSPRQELPLSVEAPVGILAHGSKNVSALIVGDFKLLTGKYADSFHQAPEWPTQQSCCEHSCRAKQVMDCGPLEAPTCLFNIREDPNETKNLAADRPDLVAQLAARLAELRKSLYAPQNADFADPKAERVWRNVYKGFVGPWKDLHEEQIVV